MTTSTADPLLAELKGLPGAPSHQAPDAAAFPGADSEPAPSSDPLDVTPRPTATPLVAAANAKHSKAVGGKGFRITVAGDYYVLASEGNGKITKRYELSFNLPSVDGALGKIVGKLLVPALKKHYPGALGYRTHEVVSAVPLTDDTPPTNSLQFMDRGRLERYIIDNAVPIDPKTYPDTAHLREACVDHKLNPNGFERREARKQAERAETRELLAMNPDLADDGAVYPPTI